MARAKITIRLTKREATLIVGVLYRDAAELNSGHDHVDANGAHRTAINKLLYALKPPDPIKRFNAVVEAAICKKKEKEKVKDERRYADQFGIFG